MSASLPTTAPDYFSSRKVSLGRARPAPSPNSPHTPLLNRSISSLYNSPGAGFRNDEENSVIIDIGARYLRIGVAGEANPRCILDFNPDEQRRVGDYRHYMQTSNGSRKRKRGSDWCRDWELYSNDVRDLDLGLVGDKLERACRKADKEILMLDERKRRLTATVSSLLPRPVLGVVLESLFNVFQAPSITLLPTPIADLVGSGLRSGIVLDIGWSETVATAMFEYREVSQQRVPRAGKQLCQVTSAMLDAICADQAPSAAPVTFEDAHEVLTRLGWCRGPTREHEDDEAAPLTEVEAALPSSPATPITIPFSKLSQPAEALFASADDSPPSSDNDDCSLPQLLFNVLLALPTDVRKICISRIVITGGSSRIPGLKHRLLGDLQDLILQRGWDSVRNYGKVHPETRVHAVLPQRIRRIDSGTARSASGTATPDSRASTPTPSRPPTQPMDDAYQTDVAHLNRPPAPPHTSASDSAPAAPTPAYQRPQEPDPILDKIQAHHGRNAPPAVPPEGEVRLVETLGAWAGASLMAGQRVKGLVEIERDAFAKDGLWGAQGALVKEGGDEKERKREARKSLGGAKAAAERGFSLGIWT